MDKATLNQLALLSRLSLAAAEEDEALQALSDMVQLIDTLREADVSGCDEAAHMQVQQLRLRDTDTPLTIGRERLLSGAPAATEDGYLAVPKVIE